MAANLLGHRPPWVLMVGFVLASCSSATSSAPDGQPAGDGGPPLVVSAPVCRGEEATITGQVFTPNGIDPVPGARVYVPANSPPAFSPTVECDVCPAIDEGHPTFWQTNSGSDGSFTLANVCPGERLLVIENGRFRRVLSLKIIAEQTLSLTAEQSRLPQKNAEFHAQDSVPKIAVVTGDYDKMECVLRNMGLDRKSYDLHEGTKFLHDPNEQQPSFSELFSDIDRLRKYNIVFINCTQDTFEDQLEKPAVRNNIGTYVREGGRLYVTDWSYDWIEQIPALAPAIDFEVGPSPPTPEPRDEASLGKDGWTVEAKITDPRLADWLALFPNTIANNEVHLEHFLGGWVIIHDRDPNTKTWVEGEVRSSDGQVRGKRPLTVTFNHNDCGKVLFTSYHTEGRDEELFPKPQAKPFPDYCDDTLSPQERILEFMVLEIANCVELVL